MAWTYHQRSHYMSKNGRKVANGYSGNGDAKDNPSKQHVKNHGPIPRGKYRIVGKPFHHPHTGPYTLRLQPAGANKMFGRDGFMIHGDSINHPGQASDGCIILSRSARQEIWESGDKTIEVIE